MRALIVGLCFYLAMLSGFVSSSFAFEAPETVSVKAGKFIYGSDRMEREYGYWLDEKAYLHSLTRQQGWYNSEEKLQDVVLPKFDITKTPITNAQYAQFLSETSHRRPWVEAKTWAGYKLVHPYSSAQRHNWLDRKAPAKRANHPVVLVSFDDAQAYAIWLSKKTGQPWRLPTEKEWEKAVRGTDGRYFPWGNKFNPALLNSHDGGPFDTLPVGQFKKAASPFGLLDGAGQVFEWTSIPVGKNRHLVKGGSWDDKGCGVCRAAARHSRPDVLKHILVGFRLVREGS